MKPRVSYLIVFNDRVSMLQGSHSQMQDTTLGMTFGKRGFLKIFMYVEGFGKIRGYWESIVDQVLQ